MPGIGAYKQRLPRPGDALPGREQALPFRQDRHFVLDAPLRGVFPGAARIQFGMGCFWGAEKRFWALPGVLSTAVGYAGGLTPNPTYREVCSGQTGHAEAVLVTYDPARVDLEALLKVFWESHDPTQGMRQGNDVGSQYRSAVYWTDPAQQAVVERSREAFQHALTAAGLGVVTTELGPAGPFYFAEDEHQQYLAKHPDGYCGLGGTGVSCPLGLGAAGD